MFKKILVANRGEIAIRVMRSCQELGIKTAVVYSDVDKSALFTKFADESYHIGKSESQESYLNIKKIIEVAKKSQAQAIHPGYGFLSENPDFAKACEQNQIIFIGPDSSILEKAGNKVGARETMQKCGIPVITGINNIKIEQRDKISEIAKEIGYPLISKATFGGGGKGMRIVKSEDELF